VIGKKGWLNGIQIERRKTNVAMGGTNCVNVFSMLEFPKKNANKKQQKQKRKQTGQTEKTTFF